MGQLKFALAGGSVLRLAVARPSPAHLVAISMDQFGIPTGLFTTNRRVAAETWHPAPDAIRMLPHFDVDHAWPLWPTNRWLTAMLRLFRQQIAALVMARDVALAELSASHSERDVFEDREFEVLNETHIAVDAQIEAVERVVFV